VFFRHHHRHFFVGSRFAAFAAVDGCFRFRHVWTPCGWVWRRVNVCF
jgi:hypothetical protein